jgi:hypothetical protein
VTEQPVGTDAATIAGAVRDNARRLGLMWRLLPGTVTEVHGPGEILVRLDGDDVQTAPVPGMSLVGNLLPGERVMCEFVPPQGVYVVGRYGGPASWQSASILGGPENLPNATFVPVGWDSAIRDNAGFFQGPLTGAINLPFAGLYAISLKMHYATGVPAATGAVLTIGTVAGTTDEMVSEESVAPGGHDTVITFSDQLTALDADTFSVTTYQATGVTRSLTSCRANITYLGAV